MLAAVRRVPRTELGAAVALAVLAALCAGPRPLLLGLLWLAAVTPRLVEVDLAQHRLPDAIVLRGYPVVTAAVVLDAAARSADPLPAILGGLLYGLVLLLLHSAGGMGLGDVKLAPLIGALVSGLIPGGAVLALVAAFLAGGAAAVVVLVRRGRRARMPFGPAMLLGAWATVTVLAS